MAETTKSGGNVWAWVFGIAALVFLALGITLFVLWRKEKAKNTEANKSKNTAGTKPAGTGISANLAINNAPPASAQTDIVAQNSPGTQIA